MAKLTLISPPSPHRDTPDPDGLPLGLLMLGAMVRDRMDVAILDAYSRALSIEDTVAEAQESEPDIVGISLPFSFSERPALEIAAGLKSSDPRPPILLGGIAATLRADELLRSPAVDAVALGEGEETIVEVLDAFTQGGLDALQAKPPAGLRMIGSEGEPVGEPRPLISDLASLPSPAFDLISGFPAEYQVRVESSRGCLFRCPYCASAPYWGRVFRAYRPERIVDEIRALRDRWGVRRVSFADDTFNQEPERARTIAEMLIKADLGVEWGASCRPEMLNEDDLRLFAQSGMTGLFLGLESGSPRVLKNIKRAHDLERTRALVEFAERLGIAVHASFMVGLPDDRPEDVEETLGYARELPASSLGFHIFHPLPGSEYGDHPEKYGIEWQLPPGKESGLGAIDAVAPIGTQHLGPMEILDYYYRGRGIAEQRRKAKEDGE